MRMIESKTSSLKFKMSLKFVCFLLVLKLAFVVSRVGSFDGISIDYGEKTGKNNAEFVTNHRERRGFMQPVLTLWKGVTATMSLLKGAKKMFTSKAYTQYVKAGGWNQAQSDFYSVKPSNILDYGLFKTGMVGDRRITVTLGTEPTVAIYIPKRLPSKTVEQIVDNILYV